MTIAKIPYAFIFGLFLAHAGAPADARAAYSATAHLVLHSEPGDFIGQGGDYDITYTNLYYGANSAQINGTLPGGAPTFLSFVLDQVGSPTNVFSILDFSTEQLGIPLAPGTYTDAQRAAFADPGHPGLDVSFQNRGSNTLTGQFTINSVSFFDDPEQGGALTIGSFSASFEQHSEGARPALFGTFTYQNFAAPAAVPEPASLGLVAMGLVALAGSARASRTLARKPS